MTERPSQHEQRTTNPVQLGATESLRDVAKHHRLEMPDGLNDPSLHRVDEMLDRLAQRESVPTQLAWRTFAASAKHLPGRARQSSAWRRVSRSRIHTSFWGQVAMAASVALTFIAASWLLIPTPGPSQDNGYALHETPEAAVDRSRSAQPAVASPTFRTAESMTWVVRHSELDYLYEASGTTLADLTGDVASIRADLGL